MVKWAEKRVVELEREGLCGYIFKSKSPSSGMVRVKVYDENVVSSNRGVLEGRGGRSCNLFRKASFAQRIETSQRTTHARRKVADSPQHQRSANHSHCRCLSVSALMACFSPEQIIAEARVAEHEGQHDHGADEQQ
jgi:hypothetical protein